MDHPADQSRFPMRRPLGFFERLRAMFAVVVVGVVWVAWAGRMILVPSDPLACVSVSTAQWGWLIVPACMVLACVLSMGVCLITAARPRDMGVFAVSLGLSLAVLRYQNAAYLWARFGGGDDAARRAEALMMALEAAAWLGVIVAAFVGSAAVVRVVGFAADEHARPASEVQNGLFTTVIMCILAALGLLIFSAGTELAPIQTGQVCFACAASFYLASLIAYQLTGASSPLWAYLAVGLVAVGGYLWIALYPTPQYPGRDISFLIQFPPAAFGRALPVQVVMIGTAAAIFGNWHQRKMTHYAVVTEGTAIPA